MIEDLRKGLETAFIDGSVVSSEAFRPQFVSNNYKEGKKVLSSIEDELLSCDEFKISVAFITLSGITPLLQTLKELEKKSIPGKILTTNYLNFSEPKALERLHTLKNIEIRMFDSENSGEGFHTKGYIFRKDEIYRIIIGSSNMTGNALRQNYEWNTKIVSTTEGEISRNIIEEFDRLWDSKYSESYDDFISEYRERYQIIKHQREIAKSEELVSLEKYKLQPNSMQVGFITNLKRIIDAGENRALLISATGTGKTYASAFAMRELGYKRVLFLVHRGQLARQSKKSYEKVFNKSVSMGLVGAGYRDYDADYIFATVQTLSRDEHLLQYASDYFDAICLDEAHHVPADTYQKIMNHFKPKLWLGMTATPDKRDDNIEGRNVYELFDYQIAYEIRLQQAMEESLLCPFHYFGITDISLVGDIKGNDLSERDFSLLTSDQRIKHIVENANYYGYSGNRVKGLIFCSLNAEARELSKKMNSMINPETGKMFRTVFLHGETPEDDRQNAFERLAIDEDDPDVISGKVTPLDYIFSRDILNEGIDIVEVNQVIMLRPTQSPIVFIQQLGRGLRKADGKKYVVILDFIGNYKNNFMIPIALSGDRSYNSDTIKKYVISGNNIIPGASTVHFDEIAKERIFASIDRIKGIKTIIKDSYVSLKNRLGRVPYLVDFYENGEVDPLLIVKEFKTYQNFLEVMESESYAGKIAPEELCILEYLSKTVLSGIRPYELEILKHLLDKKTIEFDEFNRDFYNSYGYRVDLDSYDDAVEVLQGKFVSKDEEYQKFRYIDILFESNTKCLSRMEAFAEKILHAEFYRQIYDIVKVGLIRYKEKYENANKNGELFSLYEKYSRRDVCLLMNKGKDISSTMYGMSKIGDDAFIFVTYHKESVSDKEYVDGKPDYADAFEDNVIFKWDSQMGRGVDSSYVQDVVGAKRKHLLVKKSDAESNFYYVGQFDVVDLKPAKKKDNSGKERDIAKFKMRMRHPVREDLLRYLQSTIVSTEENAV